MVIKRDIEQELNEAMASFPIVVITGARQTGKTTLAKMVADKPYFNLESPDTRALAISDPRLFLSATMEKGAIIDEFQRVPELASYLQEIVDTKGKNGMYIITGSNNFLMMENISQSLAGRAAILKLLPFSLNEINLFETTTQTNSLLYKGAYPVIYSQNRNAYKTYDNYYQTYIEKDVRQLINIKDISLFQRFISLCAGRTGQVLNMNQLASEVGTSMNTIKSWISVLEASYIVYLLQPYHKNINKRIIKSPKLYFYDTGLASYLLGLKNEKHIKNHPLRAALFENMVINEYLKYRFNHGLSNNAYFYRDNHQNEVDLLIESAGSYILVEIKSAKTYHDSFRKKLDWLEATLSAQNILKMVVYDGSQEWKNKDICICNNRHFIKHLSEQKEN